MNVVFSVHVSYLTSSASWDYSGFSFAVKGRSFVVQYTGDKKLCIRWRNSNGRRTNQQSRSKVSRRRYQSHNLWESEISKAIVLPVSEATTKDAPLIGYDSILLYILEPHVWLYLAIGYMCPNKETYGPWRKPGRQQLGRCPFFSYRFSTLFYDLLFGYVLVYLAIGYMM